MCASIPHAPCCNAHLMWLSCTMRFGSTAKVLLKCKLKYYRISECLAHRPMFQADARQHCKILDYGSAQCISVQCTNVQLHLARFVPIAMQSNTGLTTESGLEGVLMAR